MGLSQEEKERFLKALEEDRAFEYTVIGLLGIQELLRDQEEFKIRMDRLERRAYRIERNLKRVAITIEGETNDVANYYLKQRDIKSRLAQYN